MSKVLKNVAKFIRKQLSRKIFWIKFFLLRYHFLLFLICPLFCCVFLWLLFFIPWFTMQNSDLLYTISTYTTQKWSFPLKISSVNETKVAVSCRFGHITEKILNGKLYFLCSDINENDVKNTNTLYFLLHCCHVAILLHEWHCNKPSYITILSGVKFKTC